MKSTQKINIYSFKSAKFFCNLREEYIVQNGVNSQNGCHFQNGR